eukprot:TRINITY_DN12368_c0_g1_i1.p1 TRINITY_DN12368_c0_g1~~TRINITY_DN12368_c0_g1_i1.p1  ORF type:complete len:391 (-),score=64.88 TRINITY_DN12368_c0_g1_i1:183-1355(-)
MRPKTVKIIGVGLTRLGKFSERASTLTRRALEMALSDSGLTMRQLGGLVAVPSLAEQRFMEAHSLATQMGLLPQRDMIARTIDTGGAGPVTGLLEAVRLIRSEWADVVAVCAGDAVSSLTTEEFLRRADAGCRDPAQDLASPVIPHGYDRIARWHMEAYGTTREQLAMCSVVMSRQALKHPYALTKRAHTLEEVLQSKPVASVTNVLECARRADGAAALIVASSRWLERHGHDSSRGVVVLGGGEGSGPLYPPPVIDEDMFSCEEACRIAMNEAQLGTRDIDFYGLYDCFPICLIRALEAVGLAPKGKGGEWVERMYRDQPQRIPVNTHGGLLAFGAPWEVPAMYNIIEAVAQLRGAAGARQIPDARRAMVYGNGGIFSASAVAILGGKY